MKCPVQSKVKLAFELNNLSKSEYTGCLADRMKINADKRLLELDLDMILEPFKSRPGKQWWAGEHVGKFLHAATLSWRYNNDERILARMVSVANNLIDTQLPNGYLGTYLEKDQFAQGDGLGWDAPVWDVWTHKYNLIGLLTYFEATKSEPALNAAKRAADLMHDLFVVQNRSLRLASAHMGMAATSILEPIAVLYRLTGERHYLDFCHVIIDAWEDESDPETWMYEDGCRLLNSLLEHGNVFKTANRKAYEMLSNLVGLLEFYRIEPDERYYIACINAWTDITTKRLYITGTTSYFEQFTPDNRLPPGKAVGEGCVTVTWLQFNHHLLELTGEVKYADELERTMYNALLAAQSPINGEVSYFSPLKGKKSYNEHDLKMDPAISCCSSSIPRGIAMIPTFVSGLLNDKPTLLQYLPGSHVINYLINNEQNEILLSISGNYPKSGNFEIALKLTKTSKFPLVLRVPEWAEYFAATIDNIQYEANGNRLIEINRQWKSGDIITVKIPLVIRNIPDGDKTTNCTAFVRGPQVLAEDTLVEREMGIPKKAWIGDSIYTICAKQNGKKRKFLLVPFADAGQHKEEYQVIHEGIERN